MTANKYFVLVDMHIMQHAYQAGSEIRRSAHFVGHRLFKVTLKLMMKLLSETIFTEIHPLPMKSIIMDLIRSTEIISMEQEQN